MAVDLVVEGFSNGDGEAGEDLGHEGIDDAPEGDESDAQEQQVVDEEGGLSGEAGLQGACALYQVISDEEEEEGGEGADYHEGEEHPAQGGGGEGVDGGHRAAPVDEHAEEGEAEGDIYEGQVPHSEHPLPLLHHDGVYEGGEAKPGHEAGVFDGVPGPIAAPA